MKDKPLYTIIYPFMSSDLKLAGLAKECFAIIFNFWLYMGQKPVGVSLMTMQEITGGTRPAVIQAILKLEKAGLIAAQKTSGKTTKYDVILPKQTLEEFMNVYARMKLVNSLNPQEYIKNTSTSKASIPQNNKKEKIKSVNTPLKVKPAGEIHTGGLKEA